MRLQHHSFPPQKNTAGSRSQQLKKDILAHATRLHQAGRLQEAEQIYRQILAIDPQHADSLHLLGVIATQTGQFEAAIGLITQALQVSRHNPFFHCNLATALRARGRVDDAIQHYKRAIILKPDYADAHNNLGNVLVEQRRYDDAIAHFRQALAIHPAHAEAHNNLANAWKEQGRFQEAMTHYDQAIAIRPDYAEPHLNRSEIKTFQRGDADLDALQELASRNLPPAQAVMIHFALAKALDDCGDYEGAFDQMRRGNELKRRQIRYDELDGTIRFHNLVNVFDRTLIKRLQGEGDPSTVPIFVVGMPRSGSSLIEQILSSHPEVEGAGELDHLDASIASVLQARDPRAAYPHSVPAMDGAILKQIAQQYLSRLPALPSGKTRMVDKLPANFLHIGLIQLILPNARIIHVRRNPADTCLSCYSKLFASGQSFTYDLGELGRYYRNYEWLMSHWSSVLPLGAVLDVSYEDVLSDFEGQAKRLIAYCGLSWDEACLQFHANRRPVQTASAVQVRKSLFRTSVERWRNYESKLTPLLQELMLDS